MEKLIDQRGDLSAPYPGRSWRRTVAAVVLALTAMACDGSTASESAADGANRLQHETSPYLLLHAHNPVDWYPWGPEALERARREDKPIFLSVGYSTCYWCHVMERKVFADPQIAAMMNRWFINIKVDREERPDIDQIYMTATQLMSGRGGWPNSVFLTPDLRPFYAGTYFPPEDEHGRPGFTRVLTALHQYWTRRRAEVEDAAEQITTRIRQLQTDRPALASVDPDTALISRALESTKQRYDTGNGGFGGAPKFPPSMRLEFLLDAWERRQDERALRIVTHTLDAMAGGGVYDQIGGGFHRYSTDAQWRVPHFEKMLYNQAQLARVYLRAHNLVGAPRWRRLAEDILGYVEREMTAPEGGFYSALDAETEAVEGKYYVWTEEEIRDELADDADLFLALFQLAPVAETEGGSVIHRADDHAGAAASLGVEPPALEDAVGEARHRLLRRRARREYPLLDDKIITSWNGMMIAACAEAYQILGDERYRTAAERAADFVLERLTTPAGALKRVYRQGAAKYDGYLEDYAYLADGLLALHTATGGQRWLAAATAVADQMVARFWDPQTGGFYYSEEGGADLIVRVKKAADSALPAPNAIAIRCLTAVARRTDRADLRQKAGLSLRAFGAAMTQHPQAYISMVSAAWDHLGDAVALAAARPPPSPVEARGYPDAIVTAQAELSRDQVAPGDRFEALVDLRVADGWHINANPATARWLIPTSLTVNALDLPLGVERVDYPPGMRLFTTAMEESLDVYAGAVRLSSTLLLSATAAVGQQGVVRLIVQYQACDDEGVCLQPAEWVGEVPMRVETARISGSAPN